MEETRMITYAELREAENLRERSYPPQHRPKMPMERQIDIEEANFKIEQRELNGDPKANARYEEMLQWRLSPLGRILTQNPHMFRMYVTGPSGEFRSGDHALYAETMVDAQAKRDAVSATQNGVRLGDVR